MLVLNRGKKIRIIASLLVLTGILGCGCQMTSDPPSYSEYRRRELNLLKCIRDEKVAKITKWLGRQQAIIEDPKTHAFLAEAFREMSGILSGRLPREAFIALNHRIEMLFVYELGAFYDLLFIDPDGNIFYSVKMEDDFQTSLSAGPYSDTKLARKIQMTPRQSAFVDFEYYPASDEPAAFYILPIKSDGLVSGWVAFQLSINHINRLLTRRDELGRTGEAYLVNEQQVMMTASRFIHDDTVLGKKIDTAAVRGLQGLEGSDVIVDYRGVEVLSTFRVFRIGDISWRIIVEKDADEVVTDYYMQYRAMLFKPMVAAVVSWSSSHLRKNDLADTYRRKARRVDVGEWIRIDKGGNLYTAGVSTCTGFVASTDQHAFVYMAHLSPADKSYDISKIDAALLGEQGTDLIALLMRRILYFEIKPCEIKQLRFYVAAPHGQALAGIIERLVMSGVMLSQIKACVLPDARSIDLAYLGNTHAVIGLQHAKDESLMGTVQCEALPAIDAAVKAAFP